MAFRLQIGGVDFGQTSFSVQEASTPLAGGDSSGQTGTLTFTVPVIDREVAPDHPINLYGFPWLTGKEVRLDDSRKGFTVGKVLSASLGRSSGTFQVQASSKLARLNIYNTQAQPFTGTLGDAFEYYLSLAGVTTDYLVDSAIINRPVVFPGWGGELWFNLKQLAAAEDCDVTLVGGVIVLRPVREGIATRGRDVERTISVGGGSLAQRVVVKYYNNRTITNELVYPPGGWSMEVPTINVNAGESIEEILQLSASVSSIQQPVMQTFVAANYSASSVFTVVGDDGFPVQPAQWLAGGGSLSVKINEDTTSLTVSIKAPTGVYNASDGKEVGVYGISLSSESGTGRYSTLRIIGSGVAFDEQEVSVPTGVSESETGTDIGATVENRFISERETAVTVGSRAVRAYNGSGVSISGTVTGINRREEAGKLITRDYDYDQSIHAGMTYAQVQASFTGLTYSGVQLSISPASENSFDNQAFGNVAGARVWDEDSKRWYRIRGATLTPDLIQFDAEDDLTHTDYQGWAVGKTYGDLQLLYNGISYVDADLMGLRGG